MLVSNSARVISSRGWAILSGFLPAGSERSKMQSSDPVEPFSLLAVSRLESNRSLMTIGYSKSAQQNQTSGAKIT